MGYLWGNYGRIPFLTPPMTLMGFKPTTYWPSTTSTIPTEPRLHQRASHTLSKIYSANQEKGQLPKKGTTPISNRTKSFKYKFFKWIVYIGVIGPACWVQIWPYFRAELPSSLSFGYFCQNFQYKLKTRGLIVNQELHFHSKHFPSLSVSETDPLCCWSRVLPHHTVYWGLYIHGHHERSTHM